MSMINLTPAQLRQAADLKEQIETLQKQLTAILGGSATTDPIQPAKPVVVKKGGMSAAGKAKIAAAQKLRWAKVNAAKAKPAPVAKPAAKAVVKAVVAAKPAKKKFKMSAAGKARIVAAQKLRWAKINAAKAQVKPAAKPVPAQKK